MTHMLGDPPPILTAVELDELSEQLMTIDIERHRVFDSLDRGVLNAAQAEDIMRIVLDSLNVVVARLDEADRVEEAQVARRKQDELDEWMRKYGLIGKATVH